MKLDLSSLYQRSLTKKNSFFIQIPLNLSVEKHSKSSKLGVLLKCFALFHLSARRIMPFSHESKEFLAYPAYVLFLIKLLQHLAV